MITAGIELLRQVCENRFVVVLDLRRLAVKEMRRAHYPPAEHLANRLMTQANAEDRKLAGEMANDFHRHTRVIGCARSWRNHYSIRFDRRFNLINGYSVVAAHLDPLAQFTEILHQVVSERIVVVDYQEHVSSQWSVVSCQWSVVR